MRGTVRILLLSAGAQIAAAAAASSKRVFVGLEEGFVEMRIRAEIDGRLIFGVLLVNVGAIFHEEQSDGAERLLGLAQIQIAADEQLRSVMGRRK